MVEGNLQKVSTLIQLGAYCLYVFTMAVGNVLRDVSFHHKNQVLLLYFALLSLIFVHSSEVLLMEKNVLSPSSNALLHEK